MTATVQRTKTSFPNRAGDKPENDEILLAELKAAGIQTTHDMFGADSHMLEIFRRDSGEVKTSVKGYLHGWEFTRAWYYWMVKGPGLNLDVADQLHAEFGQEVRVGGHCGCPSPREWGKGFPINSYHIDTAEGLKALADIIHKAYNENEQHLVAIGSEYAGKPCGK